MVKFYFVRKFKCHRLYALAPCYIASLRFSRWTVYGIASSSIKMWQMTGMHRTHALIDLKTTRRQVSFFISSLLRSPLTQTHTYTFTCLSFFNSIRNDNCLKYLTRKILFIRSSNHEIIKRNSTTKKMKFELKRRKDKKNVYIRERNGKSNNAVIIWNSVTAEENGTETNV